MTTEEFFDALYEYSGAGGVFCPPIFVIWLNMRFVDKWKIDSAEGLAEEMREHLSALEEQGFIQQIEGKGIQTWKIFTPAEVAKNRLER